MINPTPYVKIDGGIVQGGLIPKDWAGIVVADLEISWGRELLTEHESPGQAKIKILLKARYVEWTRQPQGRRIEIGYTAPGVSVPLFHGKIEDGEIEYYDTRDGEILYLGTFNVISVLAELDRRKLPLGANRGEETWAARRAYLVGQAVATGLVSGVEPLESETILVHPSEYGDEGTAASLRTLLATIGEVLTYEPESRQIVSDGYRKHFDSSPLARLRTLPSGKVGITAQAELYGMIRASDCHMSTLQLTQKQSLRLVKVDGQLRTYEDSKWTSADHWKIDEVQALTPRREAIIQSVSTIAQSKRIGTSWDETSLDRALYHNQWFYGMETGFIHPPVTRRFKKGFADAGWARSALGTHMRQSGTWISGSVYSQLNDVTSLPRIIGGLIRFEDGVWETTHNFGSIPTRASDSLVLSEINPSSGLGTLQATNLATNPSFERRRTDGKVYQPGAIAGTGIITTGGNASADYSTDWSTSGDGCLKVSTGTTSSTAAYPYTVSGAMANMGLQPGKTYTVSATIHVPAIQTGTLDSNARRIPIGSVIAGVTNYSFSRGSQAPNTPGTYRVVNTFTVPEDAENMFVRLMNGSTNTHVYWDDYMLENGKTSGEYFDGDSTASGETEYRWTGTPHASTSQRRRNTTAFAYADYDDSVTLADLALTEQGL